MCLAIPGRIVEISEGSGLERVGIINSDGVQREINLGMVPDAAVGDSVITHSGFAIRIVPDDLLDIPPVGGGRQAVGPNR